MLARFIANKTESNPDWAERAARLAKCDLLTSMVQEFPELQGIMGRYYAQHDREVDEISYTLEEQYWPRFAGDALPTTPTGRAVALADRLDTLIGIFAIGQVPSGTRDPFALRRSALGVLRIIIESKLNLDLKQLLEHSALHLPPTIKASDATAPVFNFIMERLRGYFLEQHIRPDTIEAVLSCLPTQPFDCEQRIRAVAAFRDLPEAESLAAANKRIRNILKQIKGELPFYVHTELLTEDAERKLAGHLAELSSEVIPLMDSSLYDEALTRLTTLREPIDKFFDDVMVMTNDSELQNNRVALLNQLSSLFLRVADFSLIQN
jgi:glycyl-tRNA synthetase beta chain